jgi:Protein kinase domain/zinc-ribbon domain
MFCTTCGQQLPETARFCSRCGRAVDTDPNATVLGENPDLDGNLETLAPDIPETPRPAARTTPRPPARPPSTPSRPRSSPPGSPLMTTSDPIGGGRFAPGAIVAERYRIVALLGRGGMGEVYRAEDLKLSQVLAIKFLPEALSKDASALARFHSEVRIARQVSHPNVCRVFDIGDTDGVPFLTMEYIDGEDLSSLVRRIGRLPQDKAVEVSRQICAGLGAAHERGVIHRDLKPSNVMLDGAGKARITDFGLAGIAANIQGAEVRAGTPAYMAPEQLAGREVTAKSDIFSLGLVMYEVLTGKRAYDATTVPELMKARQAGTLTNPSTLVRDLDPLTERVILRCLETDPGKRPATPLQVAAALPGGDPLAAALAAGETPSPEMVAAAGEKEGLNPRIGLLCLAGVILALGLLVVISERVKMVSYLPFGPSPEVLVAKANEIIRTFGYVDEPVDTAHGFALQQDYIHHILDEIKTPTRWNLLKQDEPPSLMFWYRQSSQQLVSFSPQDNLIYGRIEPDEPPMVHSGARLAGLSPQGKLLNFQAIPPQVDDPLEGPLPTPNWSALFAAAGLDAAEFKPVPPRWYPLAWGDTRAAWEGTWPNHPEEPLRVEASAYRGKPIFFTLLSPWDKPARMGAQRRTRQNTILQWFNFGIILTIFAFGIWLAAKNVREGRGDLRGALRLALFVMLVGLINWALLAHHVAAAMEIVVFILALSVSLFIGMLTWLLYAALEPYVRRHWPDTLISWSRMLSGKFSDPVFGRDVFLGTLFGLAAAVMDQLQPIVEAGLGKPPMRPLGLNNFYSLEGLRGSIAMVLFQASSSFSNALLIFFLFFILRLIFKRGWLAAILLALLFCVPSIGAQNPLIDALFTAPFLLIYLWILHRFGLVALTVLYFVDQLADTMPLTTPLTAWYTEGGLVGMIAIVAVALYGFHVSRAGKPLFAGDALEI